MGDEIRALLLHSPEVALTALNEALRSQSIYTERVFTCKEAARRLVNSNPPHLVFTETDLMDGAWTDVLELAAHAPEPVNVIVVSPFADVPLYIDVMERKAFDFITVSFTAAELSHIVRCAVENACRRREERRRFRGESAKGAVQPHGAA